MDIQLPGLDGYEATRRLKADAALHAIPVIAITAYELNEAEDKARAAGCDAYMAKPISPRQLPAKVREYLPRPVPPRGSNEPARSYCAFRRGNRCMAAWGARATNRNACDRLRRHRLAGVRRFSFAFLLPRPERIRLH